jgi:hypothetical protein
MKQLEDKPYKNQSFDGIKHELQLFRFHTCSYENGIEKQVCKK